MSGIDVALLQRATECAALVFGFTPGITEIHTVTITLNGAHGGVDVTVSGTTGDGEEWNGLVVTR